MPDTAIAITTPARMDRPTSVLSGLDFESYLYNWAMYIAGEMYWNSDITQASVVMHIRGRGITISDMCSFYGTQPSTTGIFMEYDVNLDGEIHPLNIVGPAITTNKNACLQSNAAVEVTSANQSAAHKQIAAKWQQVADYMERMTWDEAKRGFIFDSTQKEGTNLVEVYCREIDSQSVPQVSDSKSGLALYRCDACDKHGITQTDNIPSAEEAGEDISETGLKTEVPCPECKAMVPAIVRPLPGKQMGASSVPVYDIKERIIPSFNFTIDTHGAKVEGLQGAEWLQIQELRTLVWMQTNFPGRTFSGPARWSYPVQAAYALSRGRWQYLNQQPRETLYASGHEKYEVRTIFLHEDAYASYRAPRDYSFVDSAGNTTFRIREGQSIAEAQEEFYGENQHGFKFQWCEQTLLTILDPSRDTLNFRDAFSDVHWSRESGSYLSSPNYSIVYIQDDITQLNTLNHNIIARNAVNPIFYDTHVFDKGDFSNEFIGTKKAALLPDFDMRGHVMSLPIPTPSPHLAQQMQWLWSIKDNVSLQTDAMRGQSTKGEPFAKARQDLETSYGNLTSVLKSFANCKVVTFKNQGKLAKKRWTLEQFQRVGSFFDEIWTEQDVEEMCEIDFDRDLIVSYREGSEMPSTPISKEMKFFGALQQLAGIPPEVALQAIGQDKWSRIVEKLGEYGDFDFDVSGLETDEIISQKRFIALAKLCLPFQDTSYDEIQMWKQKVVAIQPPSDTQVRQSIQGAQSAPNDPHAQQQAQAMVHPTPITQFDIVTEKIFHDSQIRFSQYEDMEQSQTFFVEQLRNEIGKTKPNEMLIAMLETLLGLIEQAVAGQKQEALAKDPQAQAAAAEQSQIAEEAQNKHAADMAKATADAAMNDKKIEIENKKLDLEAAKVKIEAHRADRDALLDVAKHVDGQDSEMPEAAKPVEEPIDQISIAYKDVPASAQQQILDHAGIKVSKADLEKKQKADQKPAMTKTPPKK